MEKNTGKSEICQSENVGTMKSCHGEGYACKYLLTPHPTNFALDKSIQYPDI